MTASALEASVTLDELCSVLATKRVPMAPELAGYIALEVAEHADPQAGEIDPKSVYVGEEGTVALVQPKRDNPTGDAEASVRAALARLLEASGSQTPALAAASRRPGGAGLRALVAELEAALIPVNRAAGRRALARLAREAKRAALGLGRHTLPSSSELGNRAGSRPSPSPVEHAPESRPTLGTRTSVDALVAQFSVSGPGEPGQSRELRAIAGIAETPPPPLAMPGRAAPAEDNIALTPLGDVAESYARGNSAAAETTRWSDVDEKALRDHGVPRSSGPSRRGIFRRVLGTAVVLAVACAAILAARRLHRSAPHAAPLVPSSPMPQFSAATATMRCRGMIVVSDVPRHAEVLLRVGQAPLDVERMPVGARLEFVATADSFVPKRLVVPAGVEWPEGPDRIPRFAATVELDRSHVRPGANDPWPFGEPGSEIGGQGPPGVVRVVVVPAGADVWMLSGLGPEASLEASCDRTTDILVAGPTTFRKQLHVGSGDFQTNAAGSGLSRDPPVRIARISAK
jgi:hypothetical protein